MSLVVVQNDLQAADCGHFQISCANKDMFCATENICRASCRKVFVARAQNMLRRKTCCADENMLRVDFLCKLHVIGEEMHSRL